MLSLSTSPKGTVKKLNLPDASHITSTMISSTVIQFLLSDHFRALFDTQQMNVIQLQIHFAIRTAPNLQAPFVQKVDSAIQRINLYPLDSAIGFPNTYPLDSDLSGG